MRRASNEDERPGWGRDDIFGMSDACEAALGDINDPDVYFGSDLGDQRKEVSQFFTDSTYGEVYVHVAAGTPEVIDQLRLLVESCPSYRVNGADGSEIRGGGLAVSDQVPVEGDALAFRQWFTYSEVADVSETQGWSRDGVIASVAAIPGFDAGCRR